MTQDGRAASHGEEASHGGTEARHVGTEGRATRKSNAAEVLGALRDEVGMMAARLDDVADFARKAKNALLKDADAHRLDGMLQSLHALFRIHDIAFRQERDGDADDPAREFVGSLRATIEGEMRGLGIEIIAPAAGTPHDSKSMRVLAAEGEPGETQGEAAAVTRVHRCGFSVTSGGCTEMLRKAEVDIARE